MVNQQRIHTWAKLGSPWITIISSPQLYLFQALADRGWKMSFHQILVIWRFMLWINNHNKLWIIIINNGNLIIKPVVNNDSWWWCPAVNSHDGPPMTRGLEDSCPLKLGVVQGQTVNLQEGTGWGPPESVQLKYNWLNSMVYCRYNMN